MSEEIYHNLAKVLDTLPDGFPTTDSAVFPESHYTRQHNQNRSCCDQFWKKLKSHQRLDSSTSNSRERKSNHGRICGRDRSGHNQQPLRHF